MNAPAPAAPVLFNDRVLYRPLTGVGHYARELLAALGEANAGFCIRRFLGEVVGPPRAPAPPGSVSASPPPAPAPMPRRTALRERVWMRQLMQTALKAAFRTRVACGRFALYHEPNHIPLPCSLPTVTTIHDLSGLTHPEWHPADRIRWYEREFAAGIRQATRFIAASEFTKQDLVRVVGVPAERIDVTYQAPRRAFYLRDARAAEAVRAAHHLPEQFLLFVGTLEPRKNVAGLLEAYARLPAALRRRVPLALAGGMGWKMEQLTALLHRHGVPGEVRLLGYLHDEALAGLYAASTALVWPTLFEGFGLPPLEAMACGCPVITSRVTSLPEVVGDAGVLLEPHDAPAWAETMQRMIEDDAWRVSWRARGLQQAQRFSWSACAAATRACYRTALQAAS